MTEMLNVCEKFCSDIMSIGEAREILKEFNQKFVFFLKDAEPFYIKAENGEMSVHPGKLEFDLWEVFFLESDTDTIINLFGGKLRMADAIQSGRVFSDAMSKRPYLSYLGRIIRLHHELL